MEQKITYNPRPSAFIWKDNHDIKYYKSRKEDKEQNYRTRSDTNGNNFMDNRKR